MGQIQCDKSANCLVLESLEKFRPNGPSQVPTVRDGIEQSSAAGFRHSRGDERCAEVPDPPGRSQHRPSTGGPHLLQPARSTGLRDLRQIENLPAESHPGMFGRIWIRLVGAPVISSSSRKFLWGIHSESLVKL